MELTELQNQLIEQIAKEYDFIDFKIDVQRGSQKGDNFLGEITRINVKSDSRNLGLIMKSASSSETRRQVQPIRSVFVREIYIYEKVFKEFASFEEKNNTSIPFKAYAKLFKSCDEELNESVILEDMKEKGYQMCSKRDTMNSHHIEAVIKEYASYHSVSLAMKHKDPENFKKLTESLVDIFETKMASSFPGFIKLVMVNLYKSVEDDIVSTEALKTFEDVLLKGPPTEDLNDSLVVIHGDCWCNNFLFNYKGDSKENPSNVCILDWQLAKCGSPALDLCYFLFANSSEEILNDYETYLKLYHNIIQKKLKEFSCDPETVFSYETLKKHFNKYSLKTLIMCSMVLKITLFEADEIPDMEEITEDTQLADIINSNMSNLDDYYKRISIIIKFMVKNNMFSNLN